MSTIQNPAVAKVFDQFPEGVKPSLLLLRKLIYEAANEIENDINIEETLKWGEPSYLTKHGSTIRINARKSEPNSYAIYFNCKSRLIEVIKIAYGNEFTYEGNRAMIFNLDNSPSPTTLKTCFKMALNYHKVKHLPLLGE